MTYPLFEAALHRRKSLLDMRNDTSAFRLFSGVREGVAGLVVDLYGDTLIMQLHKGKISLEPNHIFNIANWYGEKLMLQNAYLKTFVPDRSRMVAEREMFSREPLWGGPAEEEFTILENKIKFRIRPYDGFSTGLFLDQRDHRRFLSERSFGKRVLNCFSYTCGFSVGCALAGAKVTSVDVSKRYLKWGERNFEQNGLEPKNHYFVATDTLDFLRFAKKKDLRFDLIILDPPSFSRDQRGNTFSIAKDFGQLLNASVGALASDGEIFFSSNFSNWTTATLKSLVKETTESPIFLDLPELPVDFQKEENPISRVFFKPG